MGCDGAIVLGSIGVLLALVLVVDRVRNGRG